MFGNKVSFQLKSSRLSLILSKGYRPLGQGCWDLGKSRALQSVSDPGMGKESVMSRKRFAVLGLLVAFVLTLLSQNGMGATVSTRSLTGTKSSSRRVSEAAHARKRLTRLSRSRAHTARVVRTGRHRRRYYEHFTASSFMDDVTEGDIITGEDPIVRQAAINALGNMNGTVLAIEPTSGRVLA